MAWAAIVTPRRLLLNCREVERQAESESGPRQRLYIFHGDACARTDPATPPLPGTRTLIYFTGFWVTQDGESFGIRLTRTPGSRNRGCMGVWEVCRGLLRDGFSPSL